MEIRAAKIEPFLRLCSVVLLVLTACLVKLDTQTKIIVFVVRKVTYNDLRALRVLVYVDFAAAAYNLVQLSKCSLSAWWKGNLKSSSHAYLSWICYLLDQLAVYITFAATCAALEHSLLVVTGSDAFQWMKWCDRYTRFCFQIGGALACSFTACFLMALTSFLSAFNLFTLYSPERFFLFKST